MKSKKYTHGLVTSLTALSTAILCQTTATYASDIEIYKAPTNGGATLMFLLDLSGSMSQLQDDPVNKDFFNNASCTNENHDIATVLKGATYSYSGQYCFIKNSTATSVTTGTVKEETVVEERKGSGAWTVKSTSAATRTVNETSSVTNDAYSGLPASLKSRIQRSCLQLPLSDRTTSSNTSATTGNYFNQTDNGSGSNRIRTRSYIITTPSTTTSTTETGTKNSCPDRVTMLKRSLFDLIVGNSSVAGTTTTNTPLPATSSIGFTTFYNATPSVLTSPLVLNDTNKVTLLNILTQWSARGGTPIARAYSVGAAGLMNHVSTAETACAGYGVYYLTDGAPTSDSYSIATTDNDRNYLNYYLKSGSKLTYSSGDRWTPVSGNCTDSWSCVATAAGFLYNKNNTANTEVKTAIVGFGNDFSFVDSDGNGVIYNSATNYTDSVLSGSFSGNTLAAAKAAVAGKGGWYSATNTSDIVNSVQTFVDSIKVPIPAITTGTSAIPQDKLNAIAVQPYAYFPQFQPKPSENFQAWAGNLKKYNVADGILKDKKNIALFSTTSAGVLNKLNEDLWTPNYAAGTTLTADQQAIKTLGGLLSRLNLKKTGDAFNRKVYTSNGTTLLPITESYIMEAPATRGYYLGLMGYDLTDAQVTALTSSFNLSTLPTTTNELRQIGAVMHSTPVLLTQSGQITNVPAKAAQAATADKPAQEAQDAYNDTTNRDDYILFGTTQGVLHVVKAGKASEISTVNNDAGQEVFAFVPQEMLDAQGKAFLDPPNTPDGGMSALYYGVDGAWTAHTEYVYNSTDAEFKVYDSATKYGKQWVYGGLRMGGRSYYALDLTKLTVTAPADNKPIVKFRINPAENKVDGFTHASTENVRYANLGKMGESWSKPTIANVQWKGKRRLVMFVGGGYDRGYEAINYDQTNGTGAGVYMFDANTGELLWSTYDAKAATGSTTTYIGNGDELKYSIVSQIKVVDREGDGDADHLYFGDLGGQVFRIDLDSKHTAANGTAANYAKQITRIYNGHVANGYSPRFYEMPAFTVYSSTSGLFAVISIGSGNRSTPLLGKVVNATATNSGFITPNETATTNALLSKDAIYNIYDTVVTKSNPADETLPANSPTSSNLYALTSANRELLAGTGAAAPSNLAANKETTAYKGWYYAFTSSATIGDRRAVEKVQGDLIAIDNDLYVSTFDAEGTDSTESCGGGIYGTSRAHRFCMPYGQCANGDTVANNTLSLGKGLLGITMGPGTSGADRRIITPLGSLPNGNKITGITYNAANKLIPQSWYEKN